MSGLEVSISQLTGILFRGLRVANIAHMKNTQHRNA